MVQKKRYIFWDNRYKKKLTGSNDDLLHNFESKHIIKLLKKNNTNILDAGCGNGNLIKDILKKKKVRYVEGFDYSPAAIKSIKLNKQYSKFYVLDIKKIDLNFFEKKFDYIITKRLLINLDSTKEQIKIIKILSNLLKKKGQLILCESSLTGLKNINSFRVSVGLKKIKMPWHNLYINDEIFKKEKFKYLKLINIYNFTSTYYFCSRIVNALVSKIKNRKPSNNDNLSKIGWQIKNIDQDFSQTKIFHFKRND